MIDNPNVPIRTGKALVFKVALTAKLEVGSNPFIRLKIRTRYYSLPNSICSLFRPRCIMSKQTKNDVKSDCHYCTNIGI